MGLFRKNKPVEATMPPLVVSIEPHETANKEAFQKANEVNKHLNDILVQNGFTLKLWVATGGNLSGHKTNGVKEETKK